ncbi:hypothetical protein FF80_00728 [Devosia sp. LC5]|uniref:hypothetical protein n=1 Tax=Devosia sp. LC5 TaxID=1502724 RepID=UPI0004E3F0AF|nr:hypothetical protein [Devosia sp. LC5]KFC71010.1 hypothetical protein FF80_00728 [Devosia sp. LC5]
MLKHNLPDPRYECVRDHLEQALAIVPKAPGAAPLRAHIEVAVEAAIELAYRPRPQDGTLRLLQTGLAALGASRHQRRPL